MIRILRSIYIGIIIIIVAIVDTAHILVAQALILVAEWDVKDAAAVSGM